MADEADFANDYIEQFTATSLAQHQQRMRQSQANAECEECGEKPMILGNGCTARFCYDCALYFGLVG